MADSKHICSIDGCRNPAYLKTYCNSHYMRLRTHGDPLGGGTGKGEPLRWAKALALDPPQECVEWPWAKNGNGYGWASYLGKRIGAHRLLLVLATGENPPGFDASHGPCHNRKCVNPRHLSWKTRSENLTDRRRDGSSRSILNSKDVAAIRSSTASVSDMSARFGVTKSTIYKIKQGRNWV